MAQYLPPKIPNPRKAAERRRRVLSTALSVLFWLAVAAPIAFGVMAVGYSDQAPAALRSMTIAVDGFFGQPVWTILNPARTPGS